jgi:hypothetical protein
MEDGKLFLVEVDVADASPSTHGAGTGRLFRHVEHYWLCDSCASVLTLSFEQERGVVAVPMAHPLRKKPAASVRLSEAVGTTPIGNYERTQNAIGGSNDA